METAVAGKHSEALLNLALSRAAAESAGTFKPVFHLAIFFARTSKKRM